MQAALIVLILSALIGTPAVAADESTVQVPLPLDEFEARTLVAAVPGIHDAQAEGFDVYFHLWEPGAPVNTDDYYIYTVGVPNEFSQGLLGHFAVNKWTGDVWNTVLTVWECSPELEALQSTLRTLHHVDEEVIAKYRDRPIDIRETSAGYMRCRDD